METDGRQTALLAAPVLAGSWILAGFLEPGLFRETRFGAESIMVLTSGLRHVLAHVAKGRPRTDKVDALAFAVALKESRRLDDEASFHDAIYVERYSRLLPVWTPAPFVDDETVLGTWLAGGVAVSVKSFRRLAGLAGWMSAADLAEVVEAAGFGIPDDVVFLAGRRTAADSSAPSAAGPERPPTRRDPGKTFKLPGRPALEKFFNEHVVEIIFNAEKYHPFGLDHPSALVLHGPSGSGKTFAVERLVEFIDWPSFRIDSNSVGSPFIHETSTKISRVFDQAIDAAPSVLVIDEMEAFLSDRSYAGPGNVWHIEEVAEFLRRIPEAVDKKVLIIAMTNLLDHIDPAILRRGRFDHVIEVGMPSREEVAELIGSLLDKYPKDDGLQLGVVIEALSGKAMSDSAFVIREAARLAAKNGKPRIDQVSLEEALGELRRSQAAPRKPVGFFS